MTRNSQIFKPGWLTSGAYGDGLIGRCGPLPSQPLWFPGSGTRARFVGCCFS